MNVNERFALVKRNTQEILTESELRELLKKKKQPSVYIGTAITGRPHVGYFSWALKAADFLKAGFKVIILLADMHGALDNCPWDVLERRYKYYEKIIPLLIKAAGADTTRLKFVKGSSFELDKKYVLDVLRLSTIVSINGAKKAASDVVKMGDNPKLSGLLYPLLQAVDEEYLGVDVQFGGADQRKIFVLARENLPKIGYKPRVELMMPMIPGLVGKKMSASDAKSKIDLLDNEKEVVKKIKVADCVAGDTNNGVLAFVQHILFTIKQDKGESFVVERDEKYGGDLTYNEYKDLEKDFKEKTLHPLDLKMALAREINLLLQPIRKHLKELERLSKRAFSE